MEKTFSQKGHTVKHFTDGNGMPQNSVRSLAADAGGFIWITTENGLACFDGHWFNIFDKSFVGTTSNRFYMLSPSMNQTGADRPGQQKPGKEIYAAAGYHEFVKIENGDAEVENGQVLGITAKGVSRAGIDGDMLRHNGYDGRFRGMKVFWHITSDQLFFYHHKKEYRVTEQPYQGLTIRYDLDEQRVQSVYRDPATETVFLGSRSRASMLKDGTISLPSLNVQIWFLPEREIKKVPSAGIVLDRILVNSQWLTVLGDTLVLPANPVQTRFFFSTPYYGDAYNLNLSYVLVDAGEQVRASDWIPVQSNDFSIVFSNLDHGMHTLLVGKVNGFGKGNYTIRKICVIVPPLWYQTWWAKILLILLVAGGLFLYNSFRLRNISREKARLEEIVAKRTESLNLALRDVEESKNEMSRQLHMLSRLLASMTHDIQSPLNYIMLTSGAIPGMIDKGELAVVSEIGQVISNSSRRMSDLLRGLLDYIKVHVYGNSIQFENVPLNQLVESKYELFKTASEEKGNVFKNEVPAELTVSSDGQMLAIMVHNLLDNAVKFTHNGTISVTASDDAGSGVVMHISNSGAGIPLHGIEIINTPDQEGTGDVVGPSGRKTGLGLLIVKEVAVLIDVRLHVSNEAEQTRFTLQFNPPKTV